MAQDADEDQDKDRKEPSAEHASITDSPPESPQIQPPNPVILADNEIELEAQDQPGRESEDRGGPDRNNDNDSDSAIGNRNGRRRRQSRRRCLWMPFWLRRLGADFLGVCWWVSEHMKMLGGRILYYADCPCWRYV
ncbi:hypothetical protein FLONG3_5562 [Fusarium longipes]|uniref:Uncharacterized protein n=1 Tax=Fusarium longipes TaxID=694270 RepID=A0A395SV57_9HYPO|nr:hypothetical protein FLONG3_5562 [Fusarium longipes]